MAQALLLLAVITGAFFLFYTYCNSSYAHKLVFLLSSESDFLLVINLKVPIHLIVEGLYSVISVSFDRMEDRNKTRDLIISHFLAFIGATAHLESSVPVQLRKGRR